MKGALTILLFLSISSFAQTKVEAENYIKSGNVTTEASDSSVAGVDNSFVNYAISVPKAAYYTFNLRAKGTGYVNIKTVTGTTVLATVNVQGDNWQDLKARVKLSTTSKSIRFVFYGNVNLNYFTYQPETTETTTVSRQEFDDLKNEVFNLKKFIDDNKFFLDGAKFAWKDSVQRILTTLPLDN